MTEQKIELEIYEERIKDNDIRFLGSRKEPDCFNGMVMVKKFKITVEEIKEPEEVILERLEKLYRNNNKNMLNRKSINDYTKELTGKYMEDIVQDKDWKDLKEKEAKGIKEHKENE